MEEIITIYFVVLCVSFVLTRLAFLKSLGLDYNPNKEIKVMGIIVKKYYSIPKVVDEYIATKNLTVNQIKYLKAIKNWEILNFMLLALFPIVVIIALI